MNTKREKITLFAIVLGLSLLHGEPYEVGDYVTNFTDSLCSVEQEWSLFDYYYTENGGNKNVIWLVFFNTNSRRCQLEASYTQSIHNLYKNQGLITVGIGSGWGESVNCNNCGKHSKYDHSISNTYKNNNNNQPFNITYGSGSVEGIISTDKVTIGDLSIPDIKFAEITNEPGLIFKESKFDGIMGMAWRSISGPSSSPF